MRDDLRLRLSQRAARLQDAHHDRPVVYGCHERRSRPHRRRLLSSDPENEQVGHGVEVLDAHRLEDGSEAKVAKVGADGGAQLLGG